MTIETDLLVVGAGPAGLAHAFWRRHESAALDLRVVEQAPEPGGWVQTRRIEGYRCELGPQGFRPNEVSDVFLAAAGLAAAVVPADAAAQERFIARGGTLHAMPRGPKDLLGTTLLDWRGKLRLLTEPFRAAGGGGEESLAEFVGRRLGPQAVPLAEAMASGIFGGDAHAIEFAAAFPAIAALEREHGSLLRGMRARRRAPGKVPSPATMPAAATMPANATTPATAPVPATVQRAPLCSFHNGMQTLPQQLRAGLGARLMLGCPVAAVERRGERWHVTLGGEVPRAILARELVLAIPASRAAGLLAPLDAELAADLSRIPYASIANVYLGFRDAGADAGRRLRGFGFLIDRREQSPMLGAIYCSSIFPGSAPADRFLVRIMAGGAVHPDAVDREEDDLAAEAEAMLRRYTGLEAPLAFRRVYKARDAIPQYVRGHGALVARVRARAAAHPGLRLIGNSYDEVSVVGQMRAPDRAGG